MSKIKGQLLKDSLDGVLTNHVLRGCLHGGRKILAQGRSDKAEKLFVCFTCRNFGRNGYQVEKEKKNNCRP